MRRETQLEVMRRLIARIEDAARTPEDAWNLRALTTVFYNVFPNCILVFHPNWVSHMTLSPMSVDQVRITHRMLVSSELLAEAEAAPDVASRLEKSLQLIDGQVFQKEDFAIAESIQRTFAAGADEELILGGFESGMRLFHEARDRALAPTS